MLHVMAASLSCPQSFRCCKFVMPAILSCAGDQSWCCQHITATVHWASSWNVRFAASIIWCLDCQPRWISVWWQMLYTSPSDWGGHLTHHFVDSIAVWHMYDECVGHAFQVWDHERFQARVLNACVPLWTLSSESVIRHCLLTSCVRFETLLLWSACCYWHANWMCTFALMILKRSVVTFYCKFNFAEVCLHLYPWIEGLK